jgi:hypothetical protein
LNLTFEPMRHITPCNMLLKRGGLLKSANCTYLLENLVNYKIPMVQLTSSRSTTVGAFKIVLAMATLCFSPPLSFRPRSPTVVSYSEIKRESVSHAKGILTLGPFSLRTVASFIALTKSDTIQRVSRPFPPIPHEHTTYYFQFERNNTMNAMETIDRDPCICIE